MSEEDGLTRGVAKRVQKHGVFRGAAERCARENEHGQNAEKKFGIHISLL
jgi:hypothetical protein